MRILHVGCGFRPWRRGGLVEYVEDLAAAQARRGHEVTYFLSGRMYPLISGPRLRRWERDDVCHLEVVNSPLYDHGRQPELETAEPKLERMFERVIEQRRPEVVHFQEFAGLTWSLLDVARRLGIPHVVTLQDYYALCPAFKLLDHQGATCLRRQIGADCMVTTAHGGDPNMLFEATLGNAFARLGVLRPLPERSRAALVRGLARGVTAATVPVPEHARTPAAFQRRRDVNVERLARADRVVAMSPRVAEIHAQLGVDPARLATRQLTVAVVDSLVPRVASGTGPTTFATLGAFESVAKGARLLLAAVRRLSATLPAGSFRLLVFGFVDPAFAREAADIDAIEIRGPYAPAELDGLLEEVDVGLMPSIWEEAYGYAGIEFVAKGIPVIANAAGGMVEYTRDGETGWLNRSRTAPELARIMRRIVERPEQVAELNATLRRRRDELVKPHARHVDEMDAIYAETIAARREAA